MNKNLKKVISAVAALAMTASTFVAFAANYPDVDASASYKQAVDELSALNIINGYEDGTFQPDKLVNRAEFAKMVITALGKAEVAQAEAAANTNTAFPDVKGDHWAAGFVTAATQNKIINGFDDGTFKPESNITYAQAMKMLVCAAGYEQWSTDKGGWPTGYMYYGNQLGVGNGVKDVVQDTEITRAQCAQMIDNVLNVPVCVETGEMNYDIYGNQYPKLVQKNGTGVDFQSILTKKHDAYKVKGMVMGTHKSDNLDIDEVTFQIMTAKNWNDEDDQIKKSDNYEPITALIGNSEADKFLHQYVEALIAVDDDEEFEILALSLTGKNDEFTFSAANYDADEKYDAEKMYILQNNKSSNKKLSTDAEMFVNGVSVGGYTIENIEKFIKYNNVGTITLIDTPGDSNSTDGKFDYIMIDSYNTAVVDSVNVVDDETIEVSLADGDTEVMADFSPWTIDLSDEETAYSFTLDGEAYDVANLEMYDVLSIQADPTASSLGTSKFYDVKVSKASNAVAGKISTVNEPEEDEEDVDGLSLVNTEYVVDGTTYKIAHKELAGLTPGDSYTFYLDVFGRIAYQDDEATEKKIAILNAAYTNAAGKGKAEIILPDGSKAEYDLKKAAAVAGAPDLDDDESTATTNIEWAKFIVYGKTDVDTSVDEPVGAQDRVIEYSINASNELIIKDNVIPKNAAGEALEYRAAQSRFKSFTVDADTTAFISALPGEDDIKAMDASTFVDGNTYVAYFFNKSNSSNVYNFVIVTTGAGDYTPSTRVAVVQKVQSTADDDETVTALAVVIGGEAISVKVDTVAETTAKALKEGDIIVYRTDASGYITDIQKLVNLSLSAKTGYYNVFDALITNPVADLINTEAADMLTEGGNEEVTFAFGPIINDKGGITLGVVEEGEESNITDTTALDTISYDSSVSFTTINYNTNTTGGASKVAPASESAVSAVKFANSVYADGDRSIIDWGKVSSRVNPRFAFVKMVDGDATDVVVIIPKTAYDRDSDAE